jgi:hypothetical protein
MSVYRNRMPASIHADAQTPDAEQIVDQTFALLVYGIAAAQWKKNNGGIPGGQTTMDWMMMALLTLVMMSNMLGNSVGNLFRKLLAPRREPEITGTRIVASPSFGWSHG